MRSSTSATTSGVSTSNWIPLDQYATDTGPGVGIFVKLTGTGTYSVEVTGDDPWTVSNPTAYPCGVAGLTGATTSQAGGLPFPARAVRVNQTAGAGGSTVMTVVQAGLT